MKEVCGREENFGGDAELHGTTLVWSTVMLKHSSAKSLKCNGTDSQEDKTGQLEDHDAEYYKLLITLLGQR